MKQKIDKIEIISENKSQFFQNINKIDKPLARETKKIEEKTQLIKIRNESGAITINPTEIKRF